MSIIAEKGKKNLLNSAKHQFRKAGYSISDKDLCSSSFDFIAKKPNLSPVSNPVKLIIRVLAELDYFKKNTAIDLKLISKLMNANPLLIAHSATGKEIEDATLYRRHNVPAISLKTLQLFLQKKSPENPFKLEKFAYRGGIHVYLSLSRFIKLKEQSGVNLTELADNIGVSRQSLYNYAKGISSPKIENYQRMEKVMGDNLKESVDIFKDQEKVFTEHVFKKFCYPGSQLQKEIASYLEDMDFQIIWFREEPFDGMSLGDKYSVKDNEKLRSFKSYLTGVTSTDIEKNQNRKLLLKKLSNFLEKKTIWFDEDENARKSRKQRKYSFFTTLSISDLERMNSEEFLELLD